MAAKARAFAAVCFEDKFGIGIAEEDEPGYWPRPQFGKFDTFDDASAMATELNRQCGIGPQEAAMIVASSMRGHGRKRSRQ
jgi:hypothetical protein